MLIFRIHRSQQEHSRLVMAPQPATPPVLQADEGHTKVHLLGSSRIMGDYSETTSDRQKSSIKSETSGSESLRKLPKRKMRSNRVMSRSKRNSMKTRQEMGGET